MPAGYETEIISLHQFFADWLGGSVENNDAAFERVTAVLHPTFTYVLPGGHLVKREPLLKNVRMGHGHEPGVRVRVEHIRLLHQLDNQTLVVAYEEWNEDAEGKQTSRQATAVLRENSDTPHGFEWLHLHETWITPPET